MARCAVIEARQAALPIRRDEAERIPALRTPRMRDAMLFENDMLDPALL